MNTPPPIPRSGPPPLRSAPPPLPKPKPLEKTTFAGGILFLAIIAATIFGAWFCVFWLYPRVLPPGVYPRILLILPILAFGIIVAAVGSWLYKKLGIAISKPEPELKSDAPATSGDQKDQTAKPTS